MTTGDYIVGVRVERVKILLKMGVSVAEATIRCVFSSVSYFIKVFRRVTGMTPGEFQKK